MDASVIPFLTLLLGALFSFFLQTIQSSRSTDLTEISEHIAEISKIEEYAVAYWLIEADTETREAEAQALAAKLRGMLLVTSVFRERAESLLGDSFKEYAELDGKLYDSVSGGSFEQKSRGAEPQRVVEVMFVCHKLRLVLRQARKRRHWAH